MARPQKALVVDDLAVNRLILSTILTKLGFQVLEAENGLQCIDVYSQERAELVCVFLDLQMPIADGWAATKGIRDLESQTMDGEHLRVPVVVCTASCLEDLVENGQTVAQRALSLGADGAVRKPLTTNAVRRILDEYAPRWRNCLDPQAAASHSTPLTRIPALPTSPAPAPASAPASALAAAIPIPTAWRHNNTDANSNTGTHGIGFGPLSRAATAPPGVQCPYGHSLPPYTTSAFAAAALVPCRQPSAAGPDAGPQAPNNRPPGPHCQASPPPPPSLLPGGVHSTVVQHFNDLNGPQPRIRPGTWPPSPHEAPAAIPGGWTGPTTAPMAAAASVPPQRATVGGFVAWGAGSGPYCSPLTRGGRSSCRELGRGPRRERDPMEGPLAPQRRMSCDMSAAWMGMGMGMGMGLGLGMGMARPASPPALQTNPVSVAIAAAAQ